jgi:hypothetical protein
LRRRIVGLDLNGRFDLAARDWSEGEENEGLSKILILRGGTDATVVTTNDRRCVAGPLAALAPHGRGEGWGEIGARSRRRFLAHACDAVDLSPGAIEDLRAGADALARWSDEIIAAVPDIEGFAEAEQGTMIGALTNQRRRVRLLWRPVSIFLDLLETGGIQTDRADTMFRVLIHSGRGIEDQILTLRADLDHPGHFAPQRDGSGRLHSPHIGLDKLFARARAMVEGSCKTINWARCEPSRLGPALLTGDAMVGDIEVLRAWNANWLTLTAPEIEPDALDLDKAEVPAIAEPVLATFLMTPLAQPYARALVRRLERTIGPVTIVEPAAVARGCLRAGRLIEQGLPHYFDRLEPVAIAILRGEEPEFEHLIAPGSVVPANREYVSQEIGGFIWARGKADTEFYVLKGDREVRHWEVSKAPGPTEDVSVKLRIRQTPGQSWARLAVDSLDWEPLSRSPIVLDWERLTPLDLGPEEVLEQLRTQPPTIPDRIVERPHIDLWMGSYWAGNGLASQLALDALKDIPSSPARWAAELRHSRRDPEQPGERFWLVGTDGELPKDLPSELREGFLAALAQLATLATSASLERPPRDNDLLIALTWSFALCPESVQDLILEALEKNRAGKRHPLSCPDHSIRVLRQGAGRVVTGVPRLKLLFHYLTLAPLNNDTINALAMALTRREEAPRALTREQVDHFLQHLAQELLDRITHRQFQIRFRNTLSAIAGLFRWRVQEPWALLAERDPVAADLRTALVRAKSLLAESKVVIPQLEQKTSQIEAIIEYLDGRGDPDILRRIEAED